MDLQKFRAQVSESWLPYKMQNFPQIFIFLFFLVKGDPLGSSSSGGRHPQLVLRKKSRKEYFKKRCLFD